MTALDEDVLALPRGALVADVGCASGAVTRHLASLGYRVVGLELETHLVRQLRNGTEVFPCQADATCLPVRAGVLQGAVLIEVLEHVTDPAGVLRELRRVMAPGARLVIAVPTGYTERLFRRLHPRYATNAGHLSVFTLPRLTAMARQAGFEVAHVETRNLAPALAWTVHAVLRSDSDQTGTLLQHRWVDFAAAGLVRTWRALPGVNGLLTMVERRLGKSWYLTCVAS